MRLSLRLAAVAGLVLTTATAFAAAPSERRDGLWNVQLVTDTGTCDRSYNYMVSVENGSVRPLQGANASVSGQVGPNGDVNLAIRRSLAQANASGRLSERSGSGTWQLAMLGCQGRWTAMKRTQTVSN